MIRLTTIFLLLMFSLPVFADVITITLGVPSQREDNTPLAHDEIGGHRIYSETRDWDFPVASNPISSDGSVNVEIELAAGTYVLNATCYDTDGRESLFGEPMTVVSKARPGRPDTIKIKVMPNATKQ